MRSILMIAAVMLGACAVAPPASTPVAAAQIVRAASPAVMDFAEGLALKLTPAGYPAVSQLRLVERANYRTPLHIHHETDETFFVVSGELSLFVDGQKHRLGPGDYAIIPRGTPHAQGNESGSESTILLTFVPGAFEGFFDARAEIARKTPPGHPDYGPAMMALGQRFDIEVLGPEPF